jgi:hypothetical protein
MAWGVAPPPTSGRKKKKRSTDLKRKEKEKEKEKVLRACKYGFHTEKVGWLAAIKLDDVHGSHRKTSAVH